MHPNLIESGENLNIKHLSAILTIKWFGYKHFIFDIDIIRRQTIYSDAFLCLHKTTTQSSEKKKTKEVIFKNGNTFFILNANLITEDP